MTFRPAWLLRHLVDVSALNRTDIVGIGHVMAEIDALVARLRDPDHAAAMGVELPRGILLFGDPGLGKTLTARYLARSLGPDVPFFEVSADELTPARIRGALRYLGEAYPRSVLYLDEVDTFGMARDYTGHDPDTRLLLTATLAALDGLIATPGPVVIASSNRAPEFLDQALVRPGRLGFRVRLDQPDEAERLACLLMFARSIPVEDDIDWTHPARILRGESPASLRQIVSDAAGLALADGRDRMAQIDIERASARLGRIEPEQHLSDGARARLAAHESGHLAVAVALRGTSWPYSVKISPFENQTSLGDENRSEWEMSDDEARDVMVVRFGGVAAEIALLGDGSESGSHDVSLATAGAIRRITAGLTDDPAPLDLDHLGRNAAESLKEARAAALVEQVTEARRLAFEIVAANVDALRALAASVAAAGELTGPALLAALTAAGIRPARDGAG